MTIAIGCDHGGYELKKQLIPYLKELGCEIADLGCDSTDSVDYPTYGIAVGEAVSKNEAECGIVICTTGIGISIAANKVKGIRCALCTEPFLAEMSRRHNNANVLALGAKAVTVEKAKEIAKVWLSTEFEGGRHARRVGIITEYDNNR